MALRFGLIGQGPWAKNIERTLLSLADVSVLAVDRTGVPSAKLDAVLVATPSASHAEVALPYIEAGLPTFIEKPLATTEADAELIRDAALRSGAPIVVGHLYLHHPAFQKLLELLPTLGRVRYVLNESANNIPRSDTSVLWDWLPHDLSMARAIFGEDASTAESWSLTGSVPPQAALSRFAFSSTSVVCTTSWLSPYRQKRLMIVCDSGTLVFDDRAEPKLAFHDAKANVSFPTYGHESPLTRQLERFTHAVRTGEHDPSQLEAGMSVVRMIAAAERSIERGGDLVEVRPT